MLDRTNYTTRTDLEHEEVMALIEVRDDLISGKISKRQFNMNFVWKQHSCGSVGCIGGWAGRYMGLDTDQTDFWMAGLSLADARKKKNDFYISNPRFNSFHRLFYPNSLIMREATPEDGVRAINNFLKGDNDPWAFWYE